MSAITWGFVAASLVIIVVPGPSVLFTLARGVAWGRRVAVASALGNSIGTLVLASLVALGLGPVVTRWPGASIALQLAGGSYLVFLGVDALRHRHEVARTMAEPVGGRPSVSRAMRQGFTVGGLNPKALVFFLAVFPRFLRSSGSPTTVQLLAMGVVFSGLAFLSDSSWGVVAGTARAWLAGRPRRLVALRVSGGTVMVALGASVVGGALLG